MRVTKSTSPKPVELDMTPMIDMTFQLIAFFMVLINFSDAEQFQEINLPNSELAKPPDVQFEEPWTLQLTKDGKVLYDGEMLPLEALSPKLLRAVQVLDGRKMSPSQVTVIIRADGEAKIGQVQEIIKICQENRLETFTLRARQTEREEK